MYTFIINPNARSGLGGRVWEQLEPKLKESSVPYRAFFTKYQRHATAMTRKLTSDGQEHTIIVLGGDGTINEVIGGIKNLSLVTVGYIPIGSSNDFARAFSLPRNPQKALAAILSPASYSYMNVGLLFYKNRTKRFAVSAGLGFDAAICHQAVISRMKVILNRLGLGKLTYAAIAFHRLIHLRPASMQVTLDGQKTHSFSKVFFTVAMNHPYEGGGFRFCPEADPCDSLLNVMVISGISRIKALLLLPFAFKGWHTRFHGVYTYTCKEVQIESDIALPVHTDGEPVFLQHSIRACLEPEKLRVITG